MDRHALINDLMTQPWAIMPERLPAIRSALTRLAAGEDLPTLAEPEAAVRINRNRQGAVAVIPVMGTIRHRSVSLFDALFGGGASTTVTIGAAVRRAVADPNVKGVVLDVDSPGGTVPGVEELSRTIYELRGSKPIVAVANSLAASAAYWIATAADELVITPSGQVGSIGIWTLHVDESELDKRMGIAVTLISAGRYKVEGNAFEPLGEEARAELQRHVDELYDRFVADVARNRGVKASDVRGGFGEGRVVSARRAVQLGMADRVATLDETLARFGAAPSANDARAALAMRRREVDSLTI